MLKILLPVDGSDSSNKAVADFIQLLDCYKETPEIHLLNVQHPLDGNVSLFIDKENIRQYHQEEGMKKLQRARELLDLAGLGCPFHIVVGEPAEMIVNFAQEKSMDQIVIGPRGMGVVKSLLLGSVTNKVMQLSTLPVLLVK
ncbi:MAG: universal stress protein [Nitrosomonas sp.]|nr:universal stress protein [Nitrosomonas sp.]MDP1950179.1 universal stress protein [Nitrosomonas sp.]